MDSSVKKIQVSSFIIKLILTVIAVIVVIILETSWPSNDARPVSNPVQGQAADEGPTVAPPDMIANDNSTMKVATPTRTARKKKTPSTMTNTTTTRKKKKPSTMTNTTTTPTTTSSWTTTNRSTTKRNLTTTRRPKQKSVKELWASLLPVPQEMKKRSLVYRVWVPPPRQRFKFKKNVARVVRQKGIQTRIGIVRNRNEWPKVKPLAPSIIAPSVEEGGEVPEGRAEGDNTGDERKVLALIHRVDSMTYTLLHASVYPYIGTFLGLLISFYYAYCHPPMESTLMLAGAGLHSVTLYFVCVFWSELRDSTLRYTLTLAVIVLLALMVVLMLLDSGIMWLIERKPKNKKILRKPPQIKSK